MTNKERFISICDNIERDGIGDLLNYLSETDFFSAPASTKYHGAYEGGLLEHSLDVYDELIKLSKVYPDIVDGVDEDTLKIVSLFHDICKVNFYIVEQKWRKNKNDKWETYEAYAVDEKLKFGGHGSKSVFVLSRFIKLTDQEAIAINNHMSSWEEGKAREVGSVYDEHPFAWLLHIADEAATFSKNRNGEN